MKFSSSPLARCDGCQLDDACHLILIYLALDIELYLKCTGENQFLCLLVLESVHHRASAPGHMILSFIKTNNNIQRLMTTI